MLLWDTTKGSIYSADIIKDDVAQTAVVQPSDLGLNFKYLSNRKAIQFVPFLMDNVFLFPPFLPAV